MQITIETSIYSICGCYIAMAKVKKNGETTCFVTPAQKSVREAMDKLTELITS